MNTTNGLKVLLPKAAITVLLLGFATAGFASVPKQGASITDDVRHELLMLPYYNVFDELSFTVDSSNTVVLSGEVTRPILKSDAEAAVRSIEGVQQVINRIEVLPLSPYDDRIRLNTYWAIFSNPGFEKYSRAQSPIRIIVKNGNVTLDGAVANAFDKQVAEMAARSVPGVFSVIDNLQIA